MTTRENVSLLHYNTFGIDATAARFVELQEEADFRTLICSGALADGHFFVLGGGSNVVFESERPSLVVHPVNKGIRLVGRGDGLCLVEAQAGERWDDFVRHCVANGWHGLENMAAIPGTVGASPVQNVGAYGREAGDVIERVHVFDTVTGEQRWLSNAECQFGYRWSVFKGSLCGRCLVDRVEFRLAERFRPDLGYKALTDALAADGIAEPTARQVVDTVTSVRNAKLPDPALVGSAGSFFKNPVVDVERYEALKAQYPDLVAFALDDGRYKLAAGWLIERCGWKGRTLGRAAVYDRQALVLVNRGGCSGSDVRRLADAVIADVERLFGVRLECEVIFV